MGYIGLTDNVQFPVLGGYKSVCLVIIPNLCIYSVQSSVSIFCFTVRVEHKNGNRDELETKIQTIGEAGADDMVVEGLVGSGPVPDTFSGQEDAGEIWPKITTMGSR